MPTVEFCLIQFSYWRGAHIIHVSPELIWVFISNKRMRHGRNFELDHQGDVLWSLMEKQPHLQDLSVAGNQHKTSFLIQFLYLTKFQSISLSQQSLMSLPRARPGELAVRGNYLCLPQHRTMLSFFFFFVQKILYLQILEGTLQYFASEIRVFSYTECWLSEQDPASGQHGLSVSEHKLLGSPQLQSTNTHTLDILRASSGLKYTNTHTFWEIGHAL